MARPTCSSMLPGLIAAIAFILSLFAGIYCKFISFTSWSDGEMEPVTLNFGIYYYQGWSIVNSTVQGTVIYENCYNYPDGTNFDTKWQTAKAFSAMALIIGGVITFWAVLAGCLYPSKATYKKGGIIYLLVCFCQGMSVRFATFRCSIVTFFLTTYSIH